MKRKRQQIQMVVSSLTITSKYTIPEKVTNMVGTFLNEDSDGFKKIRIKTTQREPEKVTNMVGTFLNEDSDGLKKIRIKTTQMEPEKVTNMVGTFLNDESRCHYIVAKFKKLNSL
jgi:hypothetical protein